MSPVITRFVAGAVVLFAFGRIGAETLDTHTVALDADGKLLSWFVPQDGAFAHAAKLSAGFIKTAMKGPIDPANKLPVIFTHSEYHPANFTGSGWPNHPAGRNAMLAESLMLFYQYSGDAELLDAVRRLLDHQLTHGTTPASGYAWAKVPWSTSAAGNATYGTDNVVEGIGILEPDKIGELGFHGYLQFFKITGEARYRDAAVDCANALAKHVRAGSNTQSPWPFRVNAKMGALCEKPEDYCAHVIGPVRLFDDLIRLNLGDVAAYRAAREKAWKWLMTYPVANNNWMQYFEDVPANPNPFANPNQYNPGQTARYLIEHPEADPQWRTHATNLLAWIEEKFGGPDQGEPGLQHGARVISEQNAYRFKMASHTSRFAAACALLAEKTGDAALKEKAFRSLNWCTYMARDTGSVIEGPAEFRQNPNNWFSDGHGDYIRHFLLAMGAFPEWAPAGENHLLRSSSVVKSVRYRAEAIEYTTFDADATEVFRLASAPKEILANGKPLPRRPDLTEPGWTYDRATGVLRLRHAGAHEVRVLR